MPIYPAGYESQTTSLVKVKTDTDTVISLVTLSGIAIYDYASTGDDWRLDQYRISLDRHHVKVNSSDFQHTCQASLAAIAQFGESYSGWAVDGVHLIVVRDLPDLGLELFGPLVVKGGNGDTHIYRISYHVTLAGNLALG